MSEARVSVERLDKGQLKAKPKSRRMHGALPYSHSSSVPNTPELPRKARREGTPCDMIGIPGPSGLCQAISALKTMKRETSTTLVRFQSTASDMCVEDEWTAFADRKKSMSQESVASYTGPNLPVRRGRGRPIETGEYVGWREKLLLEAAQKREEARDKADDEALDRNLPPPPLSKKLQEYESRCIAEINFAPNCDIVAKSFEEADAILRVKGRCTRIKSDLKYELGKAAISLRVAAQTLYDRVDTEVNANDLDSLRRKIKSLSEENKKLQRELEEIKAKQLDIQRMPVSPQPPPNRGKPKLKANIVIKSTSQRWTPAGREAEETPSPLPEPMVLEHKVLDEHSGWPEVQRPPIKGKRKTLDEYPEGPVGEQIKSANSWFRTKMDQLFVERRDAKKDPR
ncbi:unnamed protein product [Lasius platythorax]|uniref:Gag-like protein n=1 Tax=Lasius platythorax TaxID=488582 RepID=A0AAV2MZJ6_9HYME